MPKDILNIFLVTKTPISSLIKYANKYKTDPKKIEKVVYIEAQKCILQSMTKYTFASISNWLSHNKKENCYIMLFFKSLPIFILAGICEIGGGYLIWLWLKEGKPLWYGITGGIILALYGVVATFQTSNFARVYATYGGIFIVMSLLWAMKFDKYTPDKYDIMGALIALLGVCIIYYAPRN